MGPYSRPDLRIKQSGFGIFEPERAASTWCSTAGQKTHTKVSQVILQHTNAHPFFKNFYTVVSIATLFNAKTIYHLYAAAI